MQLQFLLFQPPSIFNSTRQPVPVGNIPPATVKVELTMVTSMPPVPVPILAPSFQHVPPVPRPTPPMQISSPLSVSQEMLSSNDGIQDMKPIVSNIQPPMRPAVTVNHNILNNLSQARIINQATIAGGTSMGIPNPMAVYMSNMISSGMASTIPVAQIVISSGQSVIPSIAMSTTSTVPGSFASAANVGLTQQSTGALQSAQSKYVKVWEACSKLATNNANSATYMSRSHEQKRILKSKVIVMPLR
ncbi:mediator of RNA polymerase II transcription subunit 25 [Lactuca sativa]|uniref:mediator of RNA polymerase II transcription subunit 25 n=1 Tax=Lactuca sativa TaxID=4236 RepID=UPI001C68A2DC|nr:mediator of RNA polymerase II transcription subunit 25 [Lactuca sativa]